jgi:hypothetical protein
MKGVKIEREKLKWNKEDAGIISGKANDKKRKKVTK